MSKKCWVLSVIIGIVFLSGCAPKTPPSDRLYTVLEQAAAKEKGFEEQQEPLVASEKHEKTIYDQIIKLGLKEYGQIVPLANKGIANADKRKKYLDKETDSIKQSEHEFKKVSSVKRELKDPVEQKLADELYDIMMERYRAHASLYQKYSVAIQDDKQLYEMFKNKNLPLSELETQVKKSNEAYKEVTAANDSFNKLTEQYNAKKQELYKQAGINTKLK